MVASGRAAGARKPPNLLQWVHTGPIMVPIRVLIVDDDGAVRDSVAELLAGFGMLATCVDGGPTALMLCDGECPFDVILADVVMPGMDGVQLAKTLWDKYPGVPVVLMTGRDSVINGVIEAGAVPLYKPFSALQLKAVIDDVLEE